LEKVLLLLSPPCCAGGGGGLMGLEVLSEPFVSYWENAYTVLASQLSNNPKAQLTLYDS